MTYSDELDHLTRAVAALLEKPEQQKAGAKINRLAKQRSGMSGFALLREGRQAFTSRIAMAGTAEKTLDLQYYIWESDSTGRILAERLFQVRCHRMRRLRVLLAKLRIDLDSVRRYSPHILIKIPDLQQILRGQL